MNTFRNIANKLSLAAILMLTSQLACAEPSLKQAVDYYHQGNNLQARSVLNTLDINKPAVRFYLAKIALEQNQDAQAESLLEPNVKNTEYGNITASEWLYWLAISKARLASSAPWYKAASYANDAKQYFSDAININPHYLPARRGLFRYYLQAPGIVGGSIKKAKQQIDTMKRYSLTQAELMNLELANYENDEQHIIKAAKSLLQFPDSAEAQYQAGLIYQQRQQFDQAFSCFKAAVALLAEPQQKRFAILALYQLAKTSVIANKEYKTGTQAITQYLAETISTGMPEKHWAQFRLAQLMWLQGNITDAQKRLLELKKAALEDNYLNEKIEEFNNRMSLKAI